MSSFQLKPLIPRASTLYKVSKTPTITFRLDTTPEFCTRGTRHFLRTPSERTEAASRSARRANHTTRRTSACRSRRVRADRAQNHALATRKKRAVATAAQASVQSRSTTPPRDFWPPIKGWPLRPYRHRKRRCAHCRMPHPMPVLDSAHTQRARESCQVRLHGGRRRERSNVGGKGEQWHGCLLTCNREADRPTARRRFSVL